MLKMSYRRLKRTAEDAIFYFAPIWHLTNLRRESHDHLEELHYQVGMCRSSYNMLLERMDELEVLLAEEDLDPESRLAFTTEKRQLEARIKETEEMTRKAEEVVNTYQEELPRVVNQLDLAIQMARQTKGQRATLKMLGKSNVSDGSEMKEHIKKVRSEAYALGQQLEGHLASNRMKRKRLLTR